MNSKVENSNGANGADIAKYVVAVVLVMAGLAAWFAFVGQWATPLRAVAVVAGLVLGGLVFALTAKGRDAREFLSESRFELRKVVWPSRQDAVRMTWVVIIVVAIISVLLALLDFGIQHAVTWLLSVGRS